jgi:hypothetical protein
MAWVAYPDINEKMDAIEWQGRVLGRVDEELPDAAIRLVELLDAVDRMMQRPIDHRRTQRDEVEVRVFVADKVPR